MSWFGQEFDFDLGAADWRVLGYTSTSTTLGDLTAEVRKLPLKAFCGNRHCESWRWTKSGYYYVPKLGVAVEVRAKRDMVSCPSCQHALFWSRKHTLMGDSIEVINQDRARRNAGLDPLIGGKDEIAGENWAPISIRRKSVASAGTCEGDRVQESGEIDGVVGDGSDIRCDGAEADQNQKDESTVPAGDVAECI